MDVIVLRSKNKEIGRLVPSKRTLLVGRSPICDLVVRSSGIKTLHFLIEWIGEGDFKPNEGFWSLIDLSKSKGLTQDYSGEAHILQKEPINLDGFEFVIAKDDLAASAVAKGVLSRSMEFEDASQRTVNSGQNLVLELITYDRKNEVVTNVNHFKKNLLARGLRINSLPKLHFTGSTFQNNTVTVENQGESFLVDVFNRSERITSRINQLGKKIDVVPGDFHSFVTAESAYYLRWVPQIEAEQPPIAWTKDPTLLTLLAVFFFIGITAALMSHVEIPKSEAIPEPPRVARVEVPAPPRPPEPPAPAPPPREEKAEPIKAEQLPVPSKPKELPAEMKQATVKPNVEKVKKETAGLNIQAPPANVNTMGLLAKLKGGGKSKARVSAEDVVNKGRPTDSAVGDTGTVTFTQPEFGQIGVSKEKGGGSGDGPGLAAATTTLKVNKIAEGPSVGGLAGPRGKGKFGGTGLSGTGKGSLGSDQGLESGSMEVSGGLTKDDIRKALAENRRAIRNCYERALLARKDLEGRMVLRWKISPPGAVETISIQNSSLNMTSFENCVLDIVKKIQFPQAPNNQPTTVIYPFAFQGKT